MATTDIFSRQAQKMAGSFTTDSTQLSFGSNFGVGLITQQISTQYQQRITRLYEVGTRNVYYVVGYAEGQLNMSRIVGPSVAVATFYRKYGDACNAAENTVQIKASSAFCGGNSSSLAAGGGNNNITYSLQGVIITSIGMSMQVPDMTINEQVAAMFINMDVQTGAGAAGIAGGIGGNLNPAGDFLGNLGTPIAA